MTSPKLKRSENFFGSKRKPKIRKITNERHRKEYEDFESDIVDMPYVDYVHVEFDHRRKGVATQLYIKAAKYMASQGLVLRGGGPQRDEAVALWEKLAADDRFPTKPFPAGNKMKYLLDYR